MTSASIGVTHGKGMVVALRVVERPIRCCASRSTTPHNLRLDDLDILSDLRLWLWFGTL